MGQIGSKEWWLREQGGFLHYVFADGTNSASMFTDTIDISSLETDGNWHHLAVVLDRDDDEIRTYVDHTLVHTNTAAVIASLGACGDGTEDIRLGAFAADTPRWFDGQQDHYRVSDAALGTGDFLVIPEPATLTSLLAFGVVGALFLLRRRMRKG